MSLADSLASRALTSAKSIIDTYARGFSNGTFYNSGTLQWAYSTSGAASLCANLYRTTGDQHYLDMCTESFNYMCDHLIDQTNGHFTDEPASGNSVLETYVAGANLGWALLMLENRISHDQAFKWINALKGMWLYADTTGDLLWYPNGNWVADKVRGLFMLKEACRVWGDLAGFSYWDGRYEQQIKLLINPVSFDPRWAGFGYVVDTAGTIAKTDKSDEVGHFTEYAQGPPVSAMNGGAGTSYNNVAPFGSYDHDYTSLALEHIAQWYVASKDLRALGYLNSVTNKYMPDLDQTSWICNVVGGSRHNANGYGMNQPSIAVLRLLGNRQTSGAWWDTDAKVLDWWDKRNATAFNIGATSPPIGNVRSYSGIFGTIMYAAELAGAATGDFLTIPVGPGLGGDPTADIAVDIIGNIKVQRTKQVYGDPGTMTDVSATNPLPVAIISGGGTGGGGTASSVTVTSSALPTGAATQTTLQALLTALGATLTVDGSGHTQPVSLASQPLPTGAATQTTLQALLTALTGTLTVNGSGVTQPVSLASQPLPTGAATSAKQPALGVAGTPSTDVLTVQGSGSGTPIPVTSTAEQLSFQAGAIVAAGTTAVDLVAANTLARERTIENLDNQDAIFVGPVGVTITTGKRIGPGITATIACNNRLQVLTAAGAANVFVSETIKV